MFRLCEKMMLRGNGTESINHDFKNKKQAKFAAMNLKKLANDTLFLASI